MLGALGDDEQRVGPLAQPCLEQREEPLRAVEDGRHLGDEDRVDVGRGEGRVARDEPRVPAHQLDDADSVARPGRLDVRAPHHVDRRGERRLEPEAPVDEVDVVVDRLGHADDADGKAAPLDLAHQAHRPAQGSVAADDEEDADVEPLEDVGHGARVLLAARRSEHRAPLVMDVGDGSYGERHAVAPAGREAQVPVPEAEHLGHRVGLVQLEHDPAHDVVHARAKAAAGHDAAAELRGVEVDLVPGTRQLERGGAVGVPLVVGGRRQPVVEKNAVGVAHIVHRERRSGEPPGHGGGVAARPEDLDLHVRGVLLVLAARAFAPPAHGRAPDVERTCVLVITA